MILLRSKYQCSSNTAFEKKCDLIFLEVLVFLSVGVFAEYLQ